MNDYIRRNLESGQRCRQWFIDYSELIPGGGVTDEALLESYGAPDKWPQAVTTACDAFEASFGPQDSAKGQSVAMNAELSAKTNEMNALKSTISHLVKNYCATNPGAQAAWNTAAHVESPPKKKAPPTP